MTKEGLEKNIEKYRELSIKFESIDEEKSYLYGRCADYVEDNMWEFEDGQEDEDEDFKEIRERFKEIEEEMGNWVDMFPEGDEDDSITDFLTKE